MYAVDLKGKTGLIFGVANHRSIAWSIAKLLDSAGLKLALVYQNERLKDTVSGLAAELNNPILIQCDVTDDSQLERTFRTIKDEFGSLSVVIHSIAFANREDLGGAFSETGRDGFRTALEISSYSLLPIAKLAAPLMSQYGGSITAMTFLASEKVFPGYNIMGTAKAALENSVRQLASEFGPNGIRVNAISAGPVDTLSSRVISNYRDMKKIHLERAPLQRSVTQDDVAKTALFLCSDLSSGITGATIPVDAGYSIMGI
ncbi:enoyl-ACP reductase [SAR202 cluster bacterium AD-802-E10_MRT_200m]|nr:enoyl-ACP reductase [SAR202 cluster bacterium AD-802-E10_MRT_200m]